MKTTVYILKDTKNAMKTTEPFINATKKYDTIIISHKYR